MFPHRVKKWVALDFIEAFFYAIVAGLILRLFVFTPYRVEDHWMAPSILAGDYVLSYDLAFGLRIPFSNWKIGFRQPQRGEVVVVRYANENSGEEIKRVLGISGDRIEIRENKVFVNKKLMPWGPQGIASYGPVIVPPEHVFVVADSARSIDSSQGNGIVKESLLIGKVWKIWFSLNWEIPNPSFGSAIRWNRLFATVH